MKEDKCKRIKQNLSKMACIKDWLNQMLLKIEKLRDFCIFHADIYDFNKSYDLEHFKYSA